MISITAFQDHPNIPDLATHYGLYIEGTYLISQIQYPEDYLLKIKSEKFFSIINSMHGPFFDIIPASSDSEIKDLAKKKMTRALDACKYLGIRNIVFHTGWFPKTYPDNNWLENAFTFWNELVVEYEKDISISIENVYEDTPLLIKRLIEKVNSRSFNACLDVGHINANSTKSIKTWIEELGSSIGHLHLHNNFGKNDDHNGLNNGQISFNNVFELVDRYCPNATKNLEIRNNLEESIEEIIKYK